MAYQKTIPISDFSNLKRRRRQEKRVFRCSYIPRSFEIRLRTLMTFSLKSFPIKIQHTQKLSGLRSQETKKKTNSPVCGIWLQNWNLRFLYSFQRTMISTFWLQFRLFIFTRLLSYRLRESSLNVNEINRDDDSKFHNDTVLFYTYFSILCWII